MIVEEAYGKSGGAGRARARIGVRMVRVVRRRDFILMEEKRETNVRISKVER